MVRLSLESSPRAVGIAPLSIGAYLGFIRRSGCSGSRNNNNCAPETGRTGNACPHVARVGARRVRSPNLLALQSPTRDGFIARRILSRPPVDMLDRFRFPVTVSFCLWPARPRRKQETGKSQVAGVRLWWSGDGRCRDKLWPCGGADAVWLFDEASCRDCLSARDREPAPDPSTREAVDEGSTPPLKDDSDIASNQATVCSSSAMNAGPRRGPATGPGQRFYDSADVAYRQSGDGGHLGPHFRWCESPTPLQLRPPHLGRRSTTSTGRYLISAV